MKIFPAGGSKKTNPNKPNFKRQISVFCFPPSVFCPPSWSLPKSLSPGATPLTRSRRVQASLFLLACPRCMLTCSSAEGWGSSVSTHQIRFESCYGEKSVASADNHGGKTAKPAGQKGRFPSKRCVSERNSRFSLTMLLVSR